MTGPACATSVAVVGLGRMGLPIACALRDAGFDVLGHDIDAGRVAAAEAAGLTPVELGPVTRADVVVTVLPGSPELEDLMRGTGALLQRLGPPTLWIDLTSAAPDVAHRLGDAAAERGIEYLDAALGGGPQAATDRSLTLYVGASAAALARAHSVLDAVAGAGTVRHMGAPGTGYLTKLLINVLWFGQALATAEVLLLARAGGISLDRFQGSMGASPAATRFAAKYVPALLRGDYVASFGIDRVVEELESVQRWAELEDVPRPLLDVVTSVHRDALRRFGPLAGELLGVAELEARAGRSLTP